MMERRLNAAGSVFGHKISMLQDLERGRSLEIDALVTVQEIGRLVKVAMPNGEEPATEQELLALLRPCPDERLKIWRVDNKVGDVRNTGPELILPLEDL
jgi:hypothetical protein